jgi:hypothetical protein
VNFDVEYPLRFLKVMAKVSILKYGRNALGGYKRRPSPPHSKHTILEKRRSTGTPPF